MAGPLRGEALKAGDIAVFAVGGGNTIAIMASAGRSSGVGEPGPGQAGLFVCSNPSPNDPPAVECQAGDNEGLRASSSTNFGVHGVSTTNAGVFAENTLSGPGCLAKATKGNAVQADSVSGVGVAGTTGSPEQSAVFGFNGAKGQVPDGLNRPAGGGVWGHTTVEKGSGVVGSVDSNLSQAAGVVGIGSVAGRFFGNVEVTGSLKVDHDIQLTGDLFLSNTGKDLAEQFQVSPKAQCEPGMLMVIGENGALVPCTSAHDKRVIGVISGAGPLKPAITLGQSDGSGRTAAIALVGTVFCRVDANKAPIDAGDLLTSSDTPGHAMKANDPLKSFGTVIGKALAPLAKGLGLLPIVISLQ